MPCKYKFLVNSSTDQSRPIRIRCGRCADCRRQKQDSIVFRNLLESHTAQSATFWTLTFAPTSIQNGHSSVVRSTVRNFMQALRKSEIQAGNYQRIQFCGSYELGGMYQRPHVHLLIYNLVKNYIIPPPYQGRGIYPRFRTSLWPHGHINIMEANQRTIRYMAKYLFKDSRNPTDTYLTFQSRRPAIGFYGLQHLGRTAATRCSTLYLLPTHFQWKNRRWPADRYSRDTFLKAYIEAGGIYKPDPVMAEVEMQEYLLTLEEMPERYWYNLEAREIQDLSKETQTRQEKARQAKTAELHAQAKALQRRKKGVTAERKEEPHKKAKRGNPPEIIA